MTVILVSHSMEEAAQYAEKIFVMHQGKGPLRDSGGSLLPGRPAGGMGIEVPEVAGLTLRLNQKLDPPLPAGLLTLEALEREILCRWKRGRPR